MIPPEQRWKVIREMERDLVSFHPAPSSALKRAAVGRNQADSAAAKMIVKRLVGHSTDGWMRHRDDSRKGGFISETFNEGDEQRIAPASRRVPSPPLLFSHRHADSHIDGEQA